MLVLGVGNVLMGDEGIGVHAVRQIETEGVQPGVEVVDGGTGGLHLLSYLQTRDRIVMIDATMDGQSAGAVSLIRPRFASDFPRSLSAHDIGLRDLVEAAALLGPLPPICLITVSIDSMQPMTVELSPAVHGSIPKVVRLARRIIAAESCYVIHGYELA